MTWLERQLNSGKSFAFRQERLAHIIETQANEIVTRGRIERPIRGFSGLAFFHQNNDLAPEWLFSELRKINRLRQFSRTNPSEIRAYLTISREPKAGSPIHNFNFQGLRSSAPKPLRPIRNIELRRVAYLDERDALFLVALARSRAPRSFETSRAFSNSAKAPAIWRIAFFMGHSCR